MVEVRFIHDGEWATIESLAVYPREENKPVTYSIGRPEAPGCYRDLDRQTGFENMQAAIDQAIWLVETPDMLRAVWW